jgi:hypothetical protein
MDIVAGGMEGGKTFRLVQSFLGPTIGPMQLRSSKSPEAKTARRKLSRDLDRLYSGLDHMTCYELDLAKGEILARIAEIEEGLMVLTRLLVAALKEKK